ncbi:MAG: peptidylprolyl isomerase [Candidatus Dadabacteria bacterium]|nr:MAG: peptidylprolyl isomerase [Candidatus Dadabacteria bacterium]
MRFITPNIKTVLYFIVAVATAYPVFGQEPPFLLPKNAELIKIRSAVIKTEKGNIYLELFPKDAPWHVANFKYLADKHYYRNSIFNFHTPGFIIQGGYKPGHKKPPYELPPEFNRHKHLRGTVGMARIEDTMNPGRSSDPFQFYIMLSDGPHMDERYTVFGRVIRGMNVADSLRKGDRILDLIVYVKR